MSLHIFLVPWMKAFCGGFLWTVPFLHIGLGEVAGPQGDTPALSLGHARLSPSCACVVAIVPVTGKTVAVPVFVASLIWVHFDGQLSAFEEEGELIS